jgi:hypothetical protein
MAVKANVGTDETVAVRVQNEIDTETVVERTGITAGNRFDEGYTNYTPTTTASPTRWVMEIKTDPGNNSSNIVAPTVDIGVQV